MTAPDGTLGFHQNLKKAPNHAAGLVVALCGVEVLDNLDDASAAVQQTALHYWCDLAGLSADARDWVLAHLAALSSATPHPPEPPLPSAPGQRVLSADQVRWAQQMALAGTPLCAVAAALGVTSATVRYHLRRACQEVKSTSTREGSLDADDGQHEE